MTEYDFTDSSDLATDVIKAYQHEKEAGTYDFIFKKYNDPATVYAIKCLEGDFLSSNMIKLDSFRHLQDLVRAKEDDSFPYHYDLNKCKVILNFARIVPDVSLGKPIPLMLWQQKILCTMFGWRDSDDNKRYDRVIVSVARTNGKTYLSNIILAFAYLIESAGKTNQDLAYIAPVTQQAKKGFAYVKTTFNYLKSQPAFNQLFKQVDLAVLNDEVISRKTQNVILRLSHESGHFDSRHFVSAILDESGSNGAHGSTAAIGKIRENVGKVTSGQIQTPNHQLFQISTAYPDSNSYFYQDERMMERAMRADNSRDLDTYACMVWEQDQVSETGHPETWIKSNPLLGLSKAKHDLMLKSMLSERDTKMNSGSLAEFQNKNLNMWLAVKQNTYLKLEDINKAIVKRPPINIDGKDCFVGFDKSEFADDTAVVFMFPYVDGSQHNWYVMQHSWIPLAHAQGSITVKEKMDGVNYQAAADQGFADITHDRFGYIDDEVVFKWILNFAAEHQLKVNAFCFDAWHADERVNLWIDQKTDWLTVPVRQGTLTLNQPTVEFRRMIGSERIKWLDDPLIQYSFKNAILLEDNNGVKVDKNLRTAKIDIVDATLDAFFRAQYAFDDINLDNDGKDAFAGMTKSQLEEYWKNFTF